MRHRVAGVKLGRTPAHRRALLRNLVTALLEHEVVRTTDAKAKELRRWGDRVITLGKQGTLHARRRAAALIRRRSVVRRARSARALHGPPVEFDGEAERESARAARGGSRAGVGPGASEARRARSARALDGPPGEFDPAPGGAYKQRHARSPRPGPASRRLPLAPRGRE